MSTLEKTLYSALLEAGVKEETATAAAEKATEYVTKDDLGKLGESQSRIEEILGTLSERISAIESQNRTIQWLVGGIGFALIAALFIKLFE